MRRPYSPQTTVVPFVEPPVGTRQRPLNIFFLRGRLGSSHDPAWTAVAENSLTVVVEVVGAEARRTVADGREVRRGVAGVILSAWKALRSPDEAFGLMAVELAGCAVLLRSACVVCSSFSRYYKLGICKLGASTAHLFSVTISLCPVSSIFA
jgi:hypothetical protein